MVRYTPLYQLPALSPTDRARQIADIDWANAQAIEAILANQGQPPLNSDLVSLVTRLNAIETATKPYSLLVAPAADLAVPGTTLIGQSMDYKSGTNIPATAWSKATGAVTMPAGSDGEYIAVVALRFLTGSPTRCQAFLSVNGTGADQRMNFQDGSQNVMSAGTITLKAGDQVYPQGWTDASGSKSTASATRFSLRRLVVPT